MVCSSLFKTQLSTASVAAAPDLRSSYSYRSESFVSAWTEVSISGATFPLRSPMRTRPSMNAAIAAPWIAAAAAKR